MAAKKSSTPASRSRPIKPTGSKPAPTIRFTAKLLRPKMPASTTAQTATTAPSKSAARADWTFLTLPKIASAKLPARGQVSITGTLNNSPFQATLQPDGQGGHWLKVDRTLRDAANIQVGDTVTLDITPLAPDQEPEPAVPTDLKQALATAPPAAREAWSDITPRARRDWIQWITSGKRAETRTIRINKACDMLAKGKHRPCCFDRSGMYDKSLSCPVADDTPINPRH